MFTVTSLNSMTCWAFCLCCLFVAWMCTVPSLYGPSPGLPLSSFTISSRMWPSCHLAFLVCVIECVVIYWLNALLMMASSLTRSPCRVLQYRWVVATFSNSIAEAMTCSCSLEDEVWVQRDLADQWTSSWSSEKFERCQFVMIVQWSNLTIAF